MMIADEDKSLILRKVWCHGQSILPFAIGICCVVYTTTHSSSLPPELKIILVLSSINLFYWPFESWKAVAAAPCRSDHHYRCLFYGSQITIAVYVVILMFLMADAEHHDGFRLVIEFFAGLATIETVAFLIAVGLLKDIFYTDPIYHEESTPLIV